MNIPDSDWQQITLLANNSKNMLSSLIKDLDEKYKLERIKNKPKRAGNSIPPDGKFMNAVNSYFDKFTNQVELNHLEEWISDYFLNLKDPHEFESIQENINWLIDIGCLALDEDDHSLIWLYEDNFKDYCSHFCKRCHKEMKIRKHYSNKNGGETIEEYYCYPCENNDLIRLARTAGK